MSLPFVAVFKYMICLQLQVHAAAVICCLCICYFGVSAIGYVKGTFKKSVNEFEIRIVRNMKAKYVSDNTVRCK
jgi:hypothetical protein